MEPDVTKPPRSMGPLWLLGFVLLAAIAAIFVARAYQRPIDVAPAPRAPVAAVVDARPAPIAIDLGQGDALAAAGIKALGRAPELARWASEPELVRRLATAVNLVAEGESPRPVLGFLQPEKPFSVERRRGHFFVSAASEARYDTVARVLDGVDAGAVGRLYGTLAGYLDSAFGEVARPGKRFEGAYRAAVDRLSAVPLDEPLEVVPLQTGVGYAFADAKLEALSPAEKHLLRMGPDNARIVVAKLKAFEAAAFPGT